MDTILFLGRFIFCDTTLNLRELLGVVVDCQSEKILKCYSEQSPRSEACGSEYFHEIAPDDTVEAAYNREFKSGLVSKLPENSFAVPGFYDAHIHAIASGVRQTKGIDLSDSPS